MFVFREEKQRHHTVVQLHSSIQEHCRLIGYDNLSPIIWYKTANASFESNGNGGGFLGKPYEPNSVIKNDIEYILIERKPGGYRKPSIAKRILSIISDENHKAWFRSIWPGLTGASTRNHPALYPIEMAVQLQAASTTTFLKRFLTRSVTRFSANGFSASVCMTAPALY